ncbi:hypothetical protein [[Curtobacterium] plantarum]|uniref:Uncharacterized protein n=1 Tax=[Curtobacterium] plantarum TaxID=221276 RepID=A0ABT9T3W8_9GAMM|nr:hypothetical protein [[Curtobacterium] plantarum]MDQ0018165.1 hypothetical protein [[Curtobacterium] plantarum]
MAVTIFGFMPARLLLHYPLSDSCGGRFALERISETQGKDIAPSACTSPP